MTFLSFKAPSFSYLFQKIFIYRTAFVLNIQNLQRHGLSSKHTHILHTCSFCHIDAMWRSCWFVCVCVCVHTCKRVRVGWLSFTRYFSSLVDVPAPLYSWIKVQWGKSNATSSSFHFLRTHISPPSSILPCLAASVATATEGPGGCVGGWCSPSRHGYSSWVAVTEWHHCQLSQC